MTFNISISRRLTGSWNVVMEGRLDTSTYQIAEEKLKTIMEAKTANVVCDMGRLDYISSMGLRVIMALQKAIVRNGGFLVMLELQPPVAKVIEIAQALPREQIFSSIEEADRYFDLMQKRVREGEG